MRSSLMRMGTRVKMKLLLLSVCLILQPLSASGQCIAESPMPAVAPPTTWTAWYNVDDPTDGVDDETLATVKAVYPSVCPSPSQADCRVRFLHTNHSTAGQTLSPGCSPTGGLSCRNADQADSVRCLDYEVRFLCPSPANTVPEPYWHWDLSTKTSIDADEPLTCEGAVTSIYPNAHGNTGTIGGTLYATDSFDSSDNLCALRNSGSGYVDFGPEPDRCITEPECCHTTGLSVTFWMRNRTPVGAFQPKIVISTGGHASKARGMCVYIGINFSFDIREKDRLDIKMPVTNYVPDDQWTHHMFTFKRFVGSKYYVNGTLIFSDIISVSEGTGVRDLDNIVLFSNNDDPGTWPYIIDGDFSNLKVFYKNLNDTEVQNLYLQETSESKLVVHYLRKHSHEDSYGVELECLAKAGSPPAIVWHRSDDGAHFVEVSPSSNVAIYDSLTNSYRTRSVLVVRHLNLASDVVFSCEAVDNDRGGSVSKSITIPKRVAGAVYWTPWLSADNPVDGDDRETLSQHQLAYDLLCPYPSDIQCRTVYDSVPSNEAGQILNISCTLAAGLECLGADQGAEYDNSCLDYAIRYQCPEPVSYWTPWYDASDPDGTAEDESLDTHKAQAYPDLCSQPIGAECRLKVGQQDLIASGVVPEVPYLCNANGFFCRYDDNGGSCPDVEVRYRCPNTAAAVISVDSLLQQSHHLDPDLRLHCSATIGNPILVSFTLEWAWLDTSHPYVAASIPTGGIVSINTGPSSSVLTIENFTSSTYANTTLVCIARDDITVDAKSIQITLPSSCELPLGVANGKIEVGQITPSTFKSSPFKVPGANGLDPWVPAVSDADQSLDFDFGIDFAITGIAVQGDPSNPPPTNHLTSFRLHRKDSESGPWVLFTDDLGVSIFTSDYSIGPTSYTTLAPNITTRFLRVQPDTWDTEIMVRVELYGCAVGESTLGILHLTKEYDVITNNFTFTCRAEHYPLPTVTWLADGAPISALEGALEVAHPIDVFPRVSSSLTIKDFYPENDSVTFTCVAQAGNEVVTANISAEYKFLGTLSVAGDPDVVYGSDVILTCTASGDDIYVMEWGHRAAASGDPFDNIQSSGRYVIAMVMDNATSWYSTLTISEFAASDEGEYACLVNPNTARDTRVVSGRSGLFESWSNATYDELTNSYRIECAVTYATIGPNVTWVVPSGDRVAQTNSKYQIQSRLISAGNLTTKIASLTVHHYIYSQDDGAYQCVFTTAVQEGLNITVEAQYAYNGPISATTTKPMIGQPVHLICIAGDVERVHHADWFRVVGSDRVKIDPDATHSLSEDRSGGQFRLNLDINPYSRLDDGDYVCSINNGTGESAVVLSFTQGHGHSHGGCSGGDDHDHDPPDRGTEFSLYTKIDTDRVECLNEVTDGSGKLVFKPWDQRLDIEKYVESDDDEELLFNIPFTGNVKLKGVIMIGGNEDSHPAEMRLYKNQPNMTFDDTRSDPDQVFEMQRDTSGILEYNTKIARFSNVNHLSIHFSKNFGAETSIVYYIGLRGEFTKAQRQEIMVVQYEAYANPKDHKTSLFDNVQHEIS